MFSALKVRNFRIYWAAMFVSLVGTWIQTIAQSWLVFSLTNSAFLLGLVGFLSSIPIFLLSLFGGVLADRVNKRNILIFTQSAFMLLAFILAALTQAKLITPQLVMVIVLLNGAVMAFDAPARQTVIVELAGKENLFNAIVLNSVAFNSSRIIGPVFAGLLVAGIGISGCFYINGISFLAPIFTLFLIKINNPFINNKNNGALADLRDGHSFIKNNRLVLILLVMVGVLSLFGASYTIFMPVFANEILGVGFKGLGLLMSCAGFGALMGALILARLGDFKHKGKFLVFSSFIFSLSLVFFSLSRLYWLSLFILIFLGCSNITTIALINTILQTNVPDEFRGRIMSVFMLIFSGFVPFGNLIAGILSERMGVSFAVLSGGVICAMFFIIVNIAYPDIKNMS